MIKDNIDTVIYQFVERLQAIPSPSKNTAPQKELLHGYGPVLHIGEVSDFSIAQFDETDDSTTRKIVYVGDKMVSLSENDFADFRSHVLGLMDEPPFADSCTIDFIIDRSFDWLIAVYTAQKADMNLSTYLLDCIEKETSTYHFYFKVESLAIEQAIKVGEVSVMFFSKEKIRELYEEMLQVKPRVTMEEFTKTYSGLSVINAHIQVKGVADRAEEIAKRKIELAIDTLKCFCIDHAIEPRVTMFDLDYRSKKDGAGIFISMPGGKVSNSTIQFRNHAGVMPVELTTETIERFTRKGLQVISDFLISPADNELSYAITDLIRQLSDICSTRNNYEKIVKAISLSESILLPRLPAGKPKGITRIKKALAKIIPGIQDRSIIENLLVDFYKTRDQYLHNGTRHPVDKMKLFFFLDFQRLLILKMIELDKTMNSLDEVLNYFEIS